MKYNSAAGGRVAQAGDLLNSIDQTNWEVKLALEQDGLRSEMGGIGMNLKATLKGKDEFDKEHVPLPFDIAEISSPHPEVSSFFNKDIVPTQENFTWQFDVNRSAEEGDIELSWANHYFGDSEKQLILFDPATLQVVDMRLVNRFTISERTKKIRILFGDNDYIQQALDKELPWLGSAYPNPAKEELTIPFRVTENQDNMMVQIKIYNSHGVEIATPIQQTLPKGNYDVKWQPKGETGLYIIRMTIGQQETKAMKVIIN